MAMATQTQTQRVMCSAGKARSEALLVDVDVVLPQTPHFAAEDDDDDYDDDGDDGNDEYNGGEGEDGESRRRDMESNGSRGELFEEAYETCWAVDATHPEYNSIRRANVPQHYFPTSPTHHVINPTEQQSALFAQHVARTAASPRTRRRRRAERTYTCDNRA